MKNFLRSKRAAVISIIGVIGLSVVGVIPVSSAEHRWIVFGIAILCAVYCCFYEIWTLGHRVDYEDGTASAIKQKRICQNELKNISDYNNKSTSVVSLVLNLKKSGGGTISRDNAFDARSLMIAKAINETIRDLGVGTLSDVHITMKRGNNKIQTVSVAYPMDRDEPTLHQKEREIGVAKGYFRDQKYFKIYEGKNGELETSANPEITEDRLEKNYNRYGQYIIYPINYDGNLVGIIGIFIYKETNLAKNEDEIKEIAQKYISHYASLLELMFAVEQLMII